MKVIAKSGRYSLIVEISQDEICKILGKSSYDDVLKKLFEKDLPTETDITLPDTYSNLTSVKNVPKEIRQLKKYLENTMVFLEKAEKQAASIDQLNSK